MGAAAVGKDVPRNAQGREIWFEGASGHYMSSTAAGMYFYLAFILVGSLWAGLMALLAQFGMLQGPWALGLGLFPLVVGGLAFWRFAHRHSPSAGSTRSRARCQTLPLALPRVPVLRSIPSAAGRCP